MRKTKLRPRNNKERREIHIVPSTRTRKDHLDLSKLAALALVEQGNFCAAVGSIHLDLQEHPETKDHPDIELLADATNSKEALIECIKGFK